MKPVIVIGAGWSGAVVAAKLTSAGLDVEVLERANVVGGHSRFETLCGVTYEPNGPHIFHTDDERVIRFARSHGLDKPYELRVKTEVDVGDGDLRLMSWPIQFDELKALPDWPVICHQLQWIEDHGQPPSGDSFEQYAISLMGERLYELFIRDYTIKQWGRDPSELSSSFAPKRIDLRRDGNRNLFRDSFVAFPADRVNRAIDDLLSGTAVTCGADVTATDLQDVDASAIVVTAALDEFAEDNPGVLEWRGVQLKSRFTPCGSHERLTPAYVVNRPHMGVSYTRTVETKHATAQRVYGTVVSEEYPGASAKHYPVADVYGKNRKVNEYLQADVRAMLDPTPVFFTGRLATYCYINQDEAIIDAWACADDVLGAISGSEVAE